MPIEIWDNTSKAVADKPDTACIMAKVSPEELESIRMYTSDYGAPTHVFDIYKLRSGTYKNHRVWSQIDLGTGRWKDLFVTDESNRLVDIENDHCTLLSKTFEEPIDKFFLKEQLTNGTIDIVNSRVLRRKEEQ